MENGMDRFGMSGRSVTQFTEYTATAPGRICLFGEHQDYLGLPVIAAAISLRLCIEVNVENPILNRYRVILPDMAGEDLINTAMPIFYENRRDYLRSAINVLREAGYSLPRAMTAVISSQIPIGAGSSSSSALTVAWTCALLHGSGRAEAFDPMSVARLAHRAEVLEFNESGGMMDQIIIAHGGICFIDFSMVAMSSAIMSIRIWSPNMPQGISQ